MPPWRSAQNQWNRSARINNKPVAERMFNITTVLGDTFMVYTFGFNNLYKDSSASLKCERREMQPVIPVKAPADQSARRGCILPFVSVNIAGLVVNPTLSDFSAGQ